jgi:hypothetical protein
MFKTKLFESQITWNFSCSKQTKGAKQDSHNRQRAHMPERGELREITYQVL